MADNEILVKNVITAYSGEIVRNIADWYNLKINAYINDLPDNKVKIEISFLFARKQEVRSYQKKALGKLINRLEKDLQIKQDYITRIKYGDVEKSISNYGVIIKQTEDEIDSRFDPIEYVNSYVEYDVPKEIYDQLEMLILLDKGNYITEMAKQ